MGSSGGELRLYYGAVNTCIGMADGRPGEVRAYVLAQDGRRHPEPIAHLTTARRNKARRKWSQDGPDAIEPASDASSLSTALTGSPAPRRSGRLRR